MPTRTRRGSIAGADQSVRNQDGFFPFSSSDMREVDRRSPTWRDRMKKVLTIVFSSSVLLLSACNTVRGAADDVESVGDCVDGVEGNC